MTDIRVRIAPSPTGPLHLGTARTALFNFLFARHTGGTFIFRLEDTDQARSTEAYELDILNGLHWLGIRWDEGPAVGDEPERGAYGPYRQMQRMARYQEAAARLLVTRHALHLTVGAVVAPLRLVSDGRSLVPADPEPMEAVE